VVTEMPPSILRMVIS